MWPKLALKRQEKHAVAKDRLKLLQLDMNFSNKINYFNCNIICSKNLSIQNKHFKSYYF